jgi:hypothetical protein
MLYSNKIKPYSFVNPNLITVPKSGMASAVKSGGHVSGLTTTIALSSKKTLLGLNRLGASLHSLGETQRQIRDVLSIQLKSAKDVNKFKVRRQQYLRDQESERKTELAGQSKGDIVDKEEVKKEGEKKLSWLETLLGPFKGIVEFAMRAIITQGVLRWVSDPKNGERLQKIVSGFSKFFGFVFGIVSWSIDSFMSGVSNVFGDGSKGGLSRFAELLGGLGQILVGIAGLKAASYLLNPFSLIGDILGLLDIVSSKDTSGGGDLPTDKPGKPARAQRSAVAKFGRKALVGTLGKSGTKTALTFFKKTISPILKRIPIIGGLIDFAINVFVFKESPGKAAFKAIGAGLLGWIGGALGSVIPGPGTFVGALLGGMAGDALGGLLYDAVFGKSKKDEPYAAEGGLVTKPTRTVVGERGPELILPLGMLSSATGTGPLIATLTSALTGALSAMGSSGELAKQVISGELAEMHKLAAGARPAQPGESLGKSVVKVSTNLDLQLGGGSDEILKFLGEDSAYNKNSPRKTLRGTLANLLGVFESLSEKSLKSGRGGGGGRRGSKPTTDGVVTGGSSFSGEWGPLLELIAKKESGGNYEAMYPSTTLPGATKMTIAEVARRATGAVGKYQQLPRYLVNRAKHAGLDPNKDLYSPENQDKIASKVNIGQNRGGNAWLSGKKSEDAFMHGLAYEFAALPGPDGKFKYKGQGSSISPSDIRDALRKVREKSIKKASNGGKVKLSRGGKLTLGPSKMGNGYENIREFFEDQKATAASTTNAFSKISSDIGKLNSSAVSTEQVKAPPKINIPELTKSESVKVPPAPKNVTISAPAAPQSNNIDKLSTIAAAMEEDNNTKMTVIPIPTAINNNSASVASPRPKVVRARRPITYGF